MVSGTVRRTAAIAGGLALASGGAVIAYAQQGRPPCTPRAGNGGLVLLRAGPGEGRPVGHDQPRRAGGGDRQGVRLQPVQQRDGRDGQGAAVDAVRERRRDPEPARQPRRRVRRRETFTLAPGARKELTVTLGACPRAGTSTARSRSSASRRISPSARASCRLPPGQLAALRPGDARRDHGRRGEGRRGQGPTRALTLAVRNTGNTLDPVTGSVKLKSALGTKNLSIKADPDPARQERRRSRWCRGTRYRYRKYTATITLTQAKKNTTTRRRSR